MDSPSPPTQSHGEKGSIFFPATNGDWPTLRAALLLCQAYALVSTWNLWGARGEAGPAHLPLGDSTWLDSLQFSVNWPLLVAIAATWRWPRAGLLAMVSLLLVGMALDQWRVQPEMISFPLLILGTLPGDSPRRFGFAHLTAIWLWGGMHKLLAPDYPVGMANHLKSTVSESISRDTGVAIAWSIAIIEFLIAAFAIWPRTRRFASLFAACGHAMLLVWAVANFPVSAVWPWNLAMCLASLAYGVASHDERPVARRTTSNDASSPKGESDRSWRTVAANAVCIALVVYPAIYYANLCHGYVAFCLHSSNMPLGMWQAAPVLGEDGLLQFPPGESMLLRHERELNVPFVSMPRMCRSYLRRMGKPGDAIEMVDLRPLSKILGRRRIVFTKNEDGTIEEEIVEDRGPTMIPPRTDAGKVAS